MLFACKLRPLSSEGSLASHTYCDRGHPFITVISEDTWYLHQLSSVWRWSCHYLVFFSLFEVFRPTREFFTHLETSPLLVQGCNFDMCSALMAIEQWGFLSVPHLLCHRASVYNGHLREPATITPVAERLAVEHSLPVLTTYEIRTLITLRLRGERSNTLRHAPPAAILST